MGFSIKKYNERQRTAIKHENGPLLVVSGAGTGKTNLLVGKILYLIQEKGVKPEEILALTFSEKATQEMMERVDMELPIGYGEIWIKTFHSFCDSVLRERGHEIGLPVDFKLVTDVDLWTLMRNHMSEFKLEYFRSLGSPNRFIGLMQEHFSRLKDENILPEDYLRSAENLVKKAETEEDKELAEKHLELAHAYFVYEKLLIEKGFLDFGGLMSYAIRLFEKRKSVLREYQDRFKYILVDEFQDTNFAQNKIVTMLAATHKNLIVVGDDDQSIYKWRGASLTNIKYFQESFPGTKCVVLNENYRSSQPILDLAYGVIQKNNPNRLEVSQNIDKKLKAMNAPKTSKAVPEIFHFDELEQEVDFVVNQAAAVLKKGKSPAILIRTNALAAPFLEKLKRMSLPFQHFSATNLFTKAGVKDCISLLKVLADPWNDIAMFRFLSLPFWKINMDAILEVTRKSKYERSSLFNLMKQNKAFEKAKLILDELVEFSRENHVSDVLSKFFELSGYLKDVTSKAMSEDEKNAEILEDIANFSERVKEFESTNENKKVQDFVRYLDMLEQAGERSVNSVSIDPGAIKILTIHSAKGLEFDCVFLPGLVQWKFPSVNRAEPFAIPQELIPEPLPLGNHHMEEERRLFYVACTRAKETLVLSYSDFYDGKRQWKPSQFVLEALETGKAVQKDSKRKSKKQGAMDFENLNVDREHQEIKNKVPKLSFSQINCFSTCPLQYKFRYLFNLPSEPVGILSFGNTIHNTLRSFYEHLQNNPQEVSDNLLPLLKETYEENWLSDGYETKAILEDQKRRGLKILEDFYEKDFAVSRVIPEFIERPFKLKIGDLVVEGRIDRIDKLPDGTYEVIDYKTGSAKDKSLKNDLQLSIYALACKEVFGLQVSKLSLYYIESLEKNSTTRKDAQIEDCKEDLAKMAKEIAISDFCPTPGGHCSYCDFRLVCPAKAAVVR